MLLSPKLLLPEIASGKIIQNLAERELLTPEGVGFDLRLATLASLGSDQGSLRVETRRTPHTQALTPNGDGLFQLMPNTTYLATTFETFELPGNLSALFFPRSTLFRSGISFQSSVLPPGYIGPMTFAIHNQHIRPFEIQLHARFAHVVFVQVIGEVSVYRGQWQGGRVAQPKDESQK